MDRQSLHDLLDAATGLEPPAGAMPQNALRAGLRLRRRRRARYASAGTAALAVACVGALTVALGSGWSTPAPRPNTVPSPTIAPSPAVPGPDTLYVMTIRSDPDAVAISQRLTALVTPVPAATDRPGQPIVVARAPLQIMVAQPMVVSPDGVIWATEGVDTVTAISATTDQAQKAITVRGFAEQLLVSPDGKTVYVLDSTGAITPISTATDQPGTPIKVGWAPAGDEMAITPDGRTLYVAESQSGGSEVIPIDIATARRGAPIRVSTSASQIMVTPDGRTAYVIGGSRTGSSVEVTPISTATDKPGNPVAVGPNVDDSASDDSPLMAPDGRTMYFLVDAPGSSSPNGVLPFSTVTNTPGRMISLGNAFYPLTMAITPDGRALYVVTRPQTTPGRQCAQPGAAVVPISTATSTAGNPIQAGCVPQGIAITPDGRTAYVISGDLNGTESFVTPVTTSTNQAGKSITIAGEAIQVVVAP